MITLFLMLTGCTYNDEYSCEPWQGWWSGTMTGDLEATLVGEYYATYEWSGGLFAGGGSMSMSVRNMDMSSLLGQTEPIAPSSTSVAATHSNLECELSWLGNLELVGDLVVNWRDEDTGTGGTDTGTPDTGATEPDVRSFSGALTGSLPDPENEDPATGGGRWALDGDDVSLSGDWTLTFDADFPSAND